MKLPIILLSLAAVLVASTFAESSSTEATTSSTEASSSTSETPASTNEAQKSLRSLIVLAQTLGYNLTTSVDSTTNRYLKLYLRNSNAQLAPVISGANNLLTNLGDLRNNWEGQIEDQSDNVAVSSEFWANQTIDLVANQTNNNEDAVKQAQELIDEFVTRHSTYQSICAQKALVELTNFEDSVLKLVETVQAGVQRLSDETDSCVNGGDSTLSIRICQLQLLAVFGELRLSNAAVATQNVQAVRLSGASYAQRPCVTETLNLFQLERSLIQDRINIIITDINAAGATD